MHTPRAIGAASGATGRPTTGPAVNPRSPTRQPFTKNAQRPEKQAACLNLGTIKSVSPPTTRRESGLHSPPVILLFTNVGAPDVMQPSAETSPLPTVLNQIGRGSV
jgi:hypothetical protein